MNFPMTAEELLNALCKNGVPTEQDKAYAEVLSKLSKTSYQAGYKAGLLKQENA